MPTRNYVFAAGETKHLGSGNRLRLMSTTDPVTVKFFRNGTELVSETAEDVEAGFQGEPPRAAGQASAFDDATVTSATAQTVSIFTTRGDSRYDRSVGDVLAAPKLTQRAATPYGYDALSVNGFCFVAYANGQAVAAQLSHVQVKNPAASGKTIYVDKLRLSASLATGVGVGPYAADLITLDRLARNKNVGSAAGVAQARIENAAASLLPAADYTYRVFFATAGIIEIEFREPFVLGAGEALVAVAEAADVALSASFDIREY